MTKFHDPDRAPGSGHDYESPSFEPHDDGHDCRRNPQPETDEAGHSNELWKRTYTCAYHGCTRMWTEWYAPIFDEAEGWPDDHDCPYDGNDRVPDLDLSADTTVVEEPADAAELILEGTCYFCEESGVRVRFERESTDVRTTRHD